MIVERLARHSPSAARSVHRRFLQHWNLFRTDCSKTNTHRRGRQTAGPHNDALTVRYPSRSAGVGPWSCGVRARVWETCLGVSRTFARVCSILRPARPIRAPLRTTRSLLSGTDPWGWPMRKFTARLRGCLFLKEPRVKWTLIPIAAMRARITGTRVGERSTHGRVRPIGARMGSMRTRMRATHARINVTRTRERRARARVNTTRTRERRARARVNATRTRERRTRPSQRDSHARTTDSPESTRLCDRRCDRALGFRAFWRRHAAAAERKSSASSVIDW